ncbi:S41 family peptidase [Winogradskyella sp.]
MKIVESTKHLLRNTFLLMLIITVYGCGEGGIKAWINEDVDSEFTKQTFAKKALQKDLEYLITEMYNRHPVLDEIANEADISSKISNIKSEIQEDMTRQEFFKIIGSLNPEFKDGHSFVFPLLAEGTMAENKGKYLFPFGVIVRNNSLYLKKTYTNISSGIKLEKGSKIVSINGIPGEAILRKLAEYGHGETATLRMHMSSVFFHYWLKAIYDWDGNFSVVFEHNKNKTNLVVSNPDNWNSEQDHMGDNWLEVMPDQMAYLKLGTFDVDEETGYEQFVEDAFLKIQEENISKLIIDVRGNTGGQTQAGAEVIKYLTSEKINQASAAIEKLSESTNGIFGYKGKPGEIIKMDVTKDAIIEPVAQSKRFNGEVILLIDEMTFSAGIVFATTIQDHNLARLVGQPTGGHANQTGNITTFHLPNTKLLVLVPCRYITRVSGDTSLHRVEPDITVYEDADPKIDKTFQVALGLLNNN